MTQKRNNNLKIADVALQTAYVDAIEAKELGFVGRNLIQATLPHSNINDTQYTRTNGKFELSIISDRKIGLPYGIYPRIILCWLSTEVVIRKSREIVLGNSFNEFMKNLGLLPTGGRWGTIARFRDQVKRLFSATISCSYYDEEGGQWIRRNLNIADETVLWWEPINSGQKNLFNSIVKLSEPFYEDLLNYPVPIDLRIFKLLKHSALALDLYLWLTYRVSYLKREIHIPFPALMLQLGTGYKNDKRGRYEFKKALKLQLRKILAVWPQLKIHIDEEKKHLVIKPSLSSVNRKQYIPLGR